MNRRVIFAVSAIAAIALAIVLVVSLGGGQPTASSNSKSPLKSVTIAQFGDLLLYLPLYVAVDEGLFAKHGIAATITSTGGDDKTYAAVISDSATFGLADPTFVAIARERGQEGRVVALLIDGVPNYGVALSADTLVVAKPEDLRGRTVATVPAPSTSYTLVKELYESANLEASIREVAPAGLIAALEANQADYALLIEPWVSTVVRRGGVVAFSLDEYYPHFALTGLTASSSTIQSDPATVQAVVDALTEAAGLFYSDPDRVLEVAKNRFPTEAPEDLAAGIDRMRSEGVYPQTLEVTPEAWQAAINLRRAAGDLTREPDGIEHYVDNSFASKAAAGR